MMFSIEESRKLLEAAEVFFGYYPEYDDEEDKDMAQTLNLNDAFFWACADGEYVSDEELPRVAELFWRYGNCGILYWAAIEKNNMNKVEFADVNRFLEFVKNEEEIRKKYPDSNDRAYFKTKYIVGE